MSTHMHMRLQCLFFVVDEKSSFDGSIRRRDMSLWVSHDPNKALFSLTFVRLMRLCGFSGLTIVVIWYQRELFYRYQALFVAPSCKSCTPQIIQFFTNLLLDVAVFFSFKISIIHLYFYWFNL